MYLEFDSDDDDFWQDAQSQDPHLFDMHMSPNSTHAPSTPGNAVPRPGETPISMDQLKEVLPCDKPSVLNPRTFEPLPTSQDAHCWQNHIDTSLFTGTSMVFIRDKDPNNNGVFQEKLWQGKNRVFTLQMQGKFKRKPDGPLCFYLCALDDVASVGMISKRLGKMWMAFARNWEKGIDINFSPEPGKPIAIIAPISPHWTGILETPAGEEPPPLGTRLPTYKECIAMTGRDLGHCEDPDLDATYTFEFYTANLDLHAWRLVNIPVLPALSIHSLAPKFSGIPGCTGFAGCVREMGPEESKFVRAGTGGDLAQAYIMNRAGS